MTKPLKHKNDSPRKLLASRDRAFRRGRQLGRHEQIKVTKPRKSRAKPAPHYLFLDCWNDVAELARAAQRGTQKLSFVDFTRISWSLASYPWTGGYQDNHERALYGLVEAARFGELREPHNLQELMESVTQHTIIRTRTERVCRQLWNEYAGACCELVRRDGGTN